MLEVVTQAVDISSILIACGIIPRAFTIMRRSGRTTGSGFCRVHRRCGWMREVIDCRFPSSLVSIVRNAEHITTSGYDYSWFLLNQRIIRREFALSGSEQNPDLTGRSILKTLSRVLPGAPGPIEAFKRKGVDFIVQRHLPDLVRAMNELTGEALIDLTQLEQEIVARDREIRNAFSKDAQVDAIRGMRAYLGDRLIRVTKPHRLLDPAAGP